MNLHLRSASVLGAVFLLLSCGKHTTTPKFPYQNFKGPVVEDEDRESDIKKDFDKERNKDPENEIIEDISEEQQKKELTPEELSLQKMISILFRFALTDPQPTLLNLLQELQGTGQQPTISEDSNPYTGGLTIVRTFRPLFGTRYFHAQYLSEEETGAYLQHMSFEFRPGDDSMDLVVEALKREFPELGEPYIFTETMSAWRLTQGYHIYVSRLSLEDFENHPFNPYMDSDEGTLSIAIEIDVHGLGDSEEDEDWFDEDWFGEGGDDEFDDTEPGEDEAVEPSENN